MTIPATCASSAAAPAIGADRGCDACLDSSAPAYPRVAMHLEFVNGLTEAIVECPRCGRMLLLELLDWGGAAFNRRIFRLAALRAADVAVFRRDAQTGYCDPARLARERHALSGTARVLPVLAALDVAADTVLAQRAVPVGERPPSRHWHEGLPATADSSLFDLLGLSKHSEGEAPT